MKDNKFFEHPTIKLVGVIFMTLLLIIVSLILFEDVGLDNSLLIYNILGTLILMSFLYSFHSTNKKLYNDLSFGLNRKEFYKKYILDISFVFVIVLFLIAFYIYIYKIIVDVNISVLEAFDINKIIYLGSVFLSFSFFGFMFGIIKLKSKFFYTIVFLLSSLVIFSIIYFSIKYTLIITLGVIIISLGVINYYLIKNVTI